jgi:hypothetical protein
MDTRQIKILLEKYFEGQSTLEEEQALLDYFSGEEDPDKELLTYRRQFMLLQAGREQDPYHAEFEDRLAVMVNDRQRFPERSIKPGLIARLAIAATIAVIIGISGVLIVNNLWHRDKDTYADPQLAYAEAQKTLLYISKEMNKGIKPLSAVAKIKSGTKPLKALNKMDHSLDMLNRVSIMNNSSNLKK